MSLVAILALALYIVSIIWSVWRREFSAVYFVLLSMATLYVLAPVVH